MGNHGAKMANQRAFKQQWHRAVDAKKQASSYRRAIKAASDAHSWPPSTSPQRSEAQGKLRGNLMGFRRHHPEAFKRYKASDEWASVQRKQRRGLFKRGRVNGPGSKPRW